MKDRYGPIYRPKGKAGEYAEWALNPYRGCPHQCRYCYVPLMLRQTREQWRTQAVRPAVSVAVVERAACRMHADGIAANVTLAFTCDPYPGLSGEQDITRGVIEALTRHGHAVSVITKAGRIARRDLDLLAQAPGSRFWVTLTDMDKDNAAFDEPGAAAPEDRAGNLEAAKAAGVATAVSIEPILRPLGALAVIDRVAGLADHVYLGRPNYIGLEYDWPVVVPWLARACEERGLPYTVKRDLAAAARIPSRSNSSIFRQGEN